MDDRTDKKKKIFLFAKKNYRNNIQGIILFAITSFIITLTKLIT